MAGVKIVSGPCAEPPKPRNYADIKDQGKVPYTKTVDIATPSIGKAKITTGDRRGMGAALRGAKFTSA